MSYQDYRSGILPSISLLRWLIDCLNSPNAQSSLTVNETLSAQSAASYAFLRSQPSTNSLSSAAAAAALRNAATTPASTPVENVQTKRMLKRQSSNSSQLGRSSSVRSASRHSIQRSGSTGSMSSRTFRDGSPHLKVPENPPACGIRRAASFSRRSSSVDTPRRTDSPSTRRRSTRSVSVDREVGRSSSKYSMPSAGGNRLSTVHEVDRAENRNSVLSRDSVVFLPNGPSPNPVNEHQSMSTVPPPTTDQSSVNEVAKAQIPASNATKVSRSDTRESATWNDEASREHDNHSARTAQVAKAQSQALDATEAGRSDTNESATWNDEASRKHDNHSAKTALAAAQLASLQKDGSTKPAGLAENLDMINNKPPGWAGAQTRDKDLGAAQQPRPTHRIPRKQLSNLSVINSREPPARTELPKEHAANSSVIGGESRLSPSNERAGYGDKIASAEEKPKAKTTQPGSPGRFAHFPEVSVTGSSDKVNKSPPRAFSPAKPALKHTTRRPLSPHTQPLQSPSELSDVTSLTSDDGMRVETKKRRVKVSFDDEAEIVGVAASPPTSPEELAPPGVTLGKPKSKSPWFNVNKRKRVQLDDIFDDEYNQVLKPRPALPTFDSIREVRDMEQQQATMEYPSDTDSLSSLASTPTASSDGKVVGGTPTDTRHGDIQGREGVPNKMPEVNVESAGSADNLTPMDENSTKVSSNALDVRADNGPSSNVTRKDENTMPSFRNIFTGLDFGMNVKLPTFPITEEPEQQEESEQQVAEINGKEENETVDFYLRTYKVPGDYPSPAEQYPERPLNGSHNQFFSPGSALGSNAQFRDDSSSVYNDAAESSSGPDGVSRVAANRNQLAARRKQPRAASQSQDRSGMRRTMRATADYPGMLPFTCG